jgi:hypothetical protein
VRTSNWTKREAAQVHSRIASRLKTAVRVHISAPDARGMIAMVAVLWTGVFINYASVTYNLGMIFIETPMFTKLIEQLLTHDDYVELQRTRSSSCAS